MNLNLRSIESPTRSGDVMDKDTITQMPEMEIESIRSDESKSEEEISAVKNMQIGNFLQKKGLSNLYSLLYHPQSRKRSAVARPLSVEELEMLEAELKNQGIIKSTVNTPNIVSNNTVSDTLSKIARHQIGMLVWLARRTEVSNEQIDFKIDLREFIKSLIREKFQEGTTPNLSKYSNDEIQYLEQFASYLNGEYAEPINKYEQGLNLVLKAITITKNKHSESSLKCTLPVSKVEFVKLLKGNLQKEKKIFL